MVGENMKCEKGIKSKEKKRVIAKELNTKKNLCCGSMK